ncbi:hypothetical protein CU669_13035 [Paramagnetospirillum kuznetsovii]|uniref:Uncharacterized protein n=1 Tax=Paramagnetospirillum kuznetsovii TaxID=2053833 RepID=A0A364NWY4_9PROT|nr:hypothetical protein [Paramagnetospirillum kuznetsovii]RAU21609.1 hypothetical protein CU669_13035 [Paramagnetospirillum kuznetsovii]
MSISSATPVPATVITQHTLITPALEELAHQHSNSPYGQVVSLAAPHWSDTFIKTARFGWLRVPAWPTNAVPV